MKSINQLHQLPIWQGGARAKIHVPLLLGELTGKQCFRKTPAPVTSQEKLLGTDYSRCIENLHAVTRHRFLKHGNGLLSVSLAQQGGAEKTLRNGPAQKQLGVNRLLAQSVFNRGERLARHAGKFQPNLP